ncbi:MAG: hypothetical protein AABX11_05525 [Nanoarchaeota archaeon]
MKKLTLIIALLFVFTVVPAVLAEENMTTNSTQTCEEKATYTCITHEGRPAILIEKILSNCDKESSGQWCDYDCENGACINPPTLKEQVKCVFDNSGDIQKCYTDDGKFVCSGTGTCNTDISGDKGRKLTWKSSCGGYAYTVIDGENEDVEFKCTKTNETPTAPIPTVTPTTTPATTTKGIAKEQIKCLFRNATTEQKCYTAEENSRFYCIGGDVCLVDVNGDYGEKLTWKSTCGGYGYTITDGYSDYIEFNCIPEGDATKEAIGGRGFMNAYWQCYNGEEQKQGSESSCKSSEKWQSYAKEFCQNKCYKDQSKCGVNSFSITGECYTDSEPVIIFPVTTIPATNEEEKNNSKIEETLICKDSCPLDEKCYPFGYRKANRFCSDNGAFVEQLEGSKNCENNFECGSNVCVNNQCVSQGLIDKILTWFSRLFNSK